jgi:hypothetical protein
VYCIVFPINSLCYFLFLFFFVKSSFLSFAHESEKVDPRVTVGFKSHEAYVFGWAPGGRSRINRSFKSDLALIQPESSGPEKSVRVVL